MKYHLIKNLEFVHENKLYGAKQVYDNENDKNESIRNPDLFIIGRIWIDVLKTALVGETFKLIPVVEAAKKTPADNLVPPKRPPPMKYTDLPLYEYPHYEYKDYVESTGKCPDANVKLLHRYLLPYIKICRKKVAGCAGEIGSKVKQHCANTCAAIQDAKKQFKDNMRDPNNLQVRQAVVGISGLTGYILGGAGVPKRLFFTTLGFLAGGSLCFPKETDEVFRNSAYFAGIKFLEMYNKWCGMGVVKLREKLPSEEDMQSSPLVRKPNVCPPNT